MPTKRRILETLSLKELQDIASAYELEVDDRHVRDQLIGAASHSRKFTLADILGAYSRDRLKEICRELGLPDQGKEKAPIVDRILGNEPKQGSLKLSWSDSEGPSAPAEPPASTKTPTRPAAERAPKRSGSGKSGGDLGFEETLWQAADKLRNNMDAAEYKHVVLGLIFLKYISDAFEELHAKLCAGNGEYDGANPEDPDEYKAESVFWVPKEARWAHLQTSAKQPTIGKVVDDAMVAIERDNPRLKVLPASEWLTAQLGTRERSEAGAAGGRGMVRLRAFKEARDGC